MYVERSIRLMGRAAFVALLAAPALGAQARGSIDHAAREARQQDDSRDRWWNGERRLFTWRGTVDAETRVYIRSDRVVWRDANSGYGASQRRNGRLSTDNALPRRDGVVRVELLDGRGRVDVIQQPSEENDYTAILRVRDRQGGASSYSFAAYFEPDDFDWRVGGRGNGNGGVWSDSGGDVYSGQSVLHWSGNVDGDLRISVWRGQLGYQVVSGTQPQNVQTSVMRQLPQRDGQLSISQRQGRGQVFVIQQPSSYNNYTAIVRVLDSPAGYGYYDFDLIWR